MHRLFRISVNGSYTNNCPVTNAKFMKISLKLIIIFQFIIYSNLSPYNFTTQFLYSKTVYKSQCNFFILYLVHIFARLFNK